MDSQRLRLYRTIYNNIKYGNWSDASELGVKAGFDAYSLIDCYEHYKEDGIYYMSMRDIAILSMYMERKRYECKS